MAEVKKVEDYKSPGNTIIVKPMGLKGNTQEGGIIIPDEYQEENYFKVVGFGATFDIHGSPIKMGDTILVAGDGGDRVDIGHDVYWIFKESMVVAIVED